MPIMCWTSSCIERLYIWELSLKISEDSNWLHVQNDNFYILKWSCFIWLNMRKNYLHHYRVEHVFVSCCQSICLQPQDELRPFVRPQCQQMRYSVPERPLLQVSRALPVGSVDALLWLRRANPPGDAAEERPGRVSGLGQAGQRRGRGSHRYLFACEEARNLTSKSSDKNIFKRNPVGVPRSWAQVTIIRRCCWCSLQLKESDKVMLGTTSTECVKPIPKKKKKKKKKSADTRGRRSCPVAENEKKNLISPLQKPTAGLQRCTHTSRWAKNCYLI